MKHILININTAYAQHCCVTLCSLFENNREERFHVHIFSFDLNDESQTKIKSFAEGYGSMVTFYILDDTNMQFPNTEGHHVSKEAYIRLFAPDYLPHSIEKILYLDVDILVVNDIGGLLSTEMGDRIIAAIEDAPLEERYARLDIDRKYGYFNSGVMLINLKEWRKNNISERAVRIMNEGGVFLRHHDQDILNMLCYDKWKRIPFRWNILDVFYSDYSYYEERYIKEIKKELDNVCIVHFSGVIKPWKAWTPHPYFKDYYRYLKKTPWKGFRIPLRTQWETYYFPRNILTIIKIDRILVPLKRKIIDLLK